MHISKEAAIFLRVQIFLAALCTAIFFGLFLLCRNGRSATLYWVAMPICLFFTPKSWLRELRFVWLQWWDMDKRDTRQLLLTALIATVIFSLAAHMFAFSNIFFNHDSLRFVAYLREFTTWLDVGRPFITLMDTLAGTVSAPWLMGLMFTIWMFLASVFVIRLFQIRNTFSRVLVCGLLCTNITLSNVCALFTFVISDYSFALMMAIASVWLFLCCRHGELLGVYCMTLSMLIYQAYFTAALTFAFLVVIRSLVNSETALGVVQRGIRYLVLMAMSFCLYYATWTVLCNVYSVEKGRMGDSTLFYGPMFFLKRFMGSFSDYFQTRLTSQNFLGRLAPAINLLAFGLALLWLLGWLMDKQLPKSNKFLLALSICLLPAAFNTAYIFFIQTTQSHYAVGKEILGIFLLLCLSCPAPAFPVQRRSQAAALLLASALLWQNIVYSNELYIKMDMNKEATVSIFTRIIERVEQLDGYIPGTTPVAFSGSLVNNTFVSPGRKGYEWFSPQSVGAATYDYTTSWTTVYFIRDYLNYPMNHAQVPSGDAEVAVIQAMPAFPFHGSIAWVGDTVVVKLS